MNQGASHELSAFIAQLARELPGPLVERVAHWLEVMPATGRREFLVECATTPNAQAKLRALLVIWQGQPDIAPASVALALRVGAQAESWRVTQASAELVWTGPTSLDTDWRRTEQVLLHLIDAAEHTLWLVTFAAYRVPEVADALARAASRGVRILFVAESATESEGKITYDAIASLGDDLPRQTQVYVWPKDERPTEPDGRFGALHAKCAVADDRLALVSSANLTGSALHLNIEAGVLLHGELAARISGQLRSLVQNGTLRLT